LKDHREIITEDVTIADVIIVETIEEETKL